MEEWQMETAAFPNKMLSGNFFHSIAQNVSNVATLGYGGAPAEGLSPRQQ